MVKVSFVNSNYYLNTPGGIEVQLYQMAKGLAAEDGYQVYYVTPDIDRSAKSNGIELVKLGGKRGDRDYTYTDFARIMDQLSPDIVLQMGRKQLTYFAGRYCGGKRIPFLFAAASDIDCKYFREVPRFVLEYPLRRAMNPVRIWRALKKDLQVLMGLKNASRLVAQTRHQEEILQKRFGSKTTFYQNPHDVPGEDTIVKSSPPMVLWLASIKSGKRPEIFLEIAKALDETGYRVVMAGRMDEAHYRRDIENAVSAGYLEYIEDVSFERSNELISEARVFVLTSVYEGLPNTLIQAWLRRTPTVSCGFDPDGVISKHGLGVFVETVDKAAAAICELLSNPERCDLIGDCARRFAMEHFGMDAQITRLRGIIDSAVRDAH